MSLQAIRERASGWVLYVIIGIIIVPFALWGINQYVAGGGKINAAVVNGEEISASYFQNKYLDSKEVYKKQMMQMMGDKYDPSTIDEALLRKEVLDQLIKEKLQEKWIDDNGLKVGEEQIISYIKDLEIFKDDKGGFSRQKFDEWMVRQGMNFGYFSQVVISNHLLNRGFRMGFEETSFVTKPETERMQSLNSQERKFSYVTIRGNAFLSEVQPSDEELKKYYEENSKDYMSAETVKLQYVEISAETLKDQVNITEKDILTKYEKNLDGYTVEEQRKVSHILVAVQQDASDEDVAKAKERINEIVKKITVDADFAEIAKKNSDDPGSANGGGDIGYFAKNGAAEAEFENVAFKLETVGQVSDPVRTKYGFHLIKLTGIQPATVKTLAEVKVQLENDLRAKAVRDIITQQSEEIKNLAYEEPDSLKPVADFVKIAIKESEFGSKNSRKGIFVHKAVSREAFGDNVLTDGNNSTLIRIGNNLAYVIRIKEHKVASVLPFEEVKQKIKNRLTLDGSKKLAKLKGEELKDLIAKGGDLKTLAEKEKLKVVEVDFIKRDDRKQKRDIVKNVFSLSRPAKDSISTGSLELYSGDYVLTALYDVKDGVVENAENAEAAKTEKESQERDLGRKVLNSLIEAMRETGTISINEDVLKVDQ